MSDPEEPFLICILHNPDTKLDINTLCENLIQCIDFHSKTFWPINTNNYQAIDKKLSQEPTLTIYLNEDKMSANTNNATLLQPKQITQYWQTLDISQTATIKAVEKIICACLDIRFQQKVEKSLQPKKLERSLQI